MPGCVKVNKNWQGDHHKTNNVSQNNFVGRYLSYGFFFMILLNKSSRLKKTGFSLLEILCVLSIMSVLAALVFPTFLIARGKARQVSCSSNLKQIGAAFALYMQDFDSRYPIAIDPADLYTSQSWSSLPDFRATIPQLPMLHQVMRPYIESPTLFLCPSDSGFQITDFTYLILDATPTSYDKFGTSYYYRTEIAARQAGDFTITSPAQINILMDGSGTWHGTLFPLAQRYNVLFADGHVKNINRAQIDEAWNTPLQ